MPFNFVRRRWSKPETKFDVYYQRISSGDRVTEQFKSPQGDTIKEFRSKLVADLQRSSGDREEDALSPESFYLFRRQSKGVFDGMLFESTLIGESFHDNKQEPLFLLHPRDLLIFQFVDCETRQTFPFNHLVYFDAVLANKDPTALLHPLSDYFKGTRELSVEIEGCVVPISEVQQGAFKAGNTYNVLAKLKTSRTAEE